MDDKMNEMMSSFFAAAKNGTQQKSFKDDLNFFGIVEGKNKYRFVPYNDMVFNKTTKHFTKHFGVIDRESKRGISIICTMDKYKTCPFCEEYSRAVELDQGDAFKKAPQNFYNFYAIDHEGKPGILEMDEMCFGQFSKYVQKCIQDEDYGKRNLMSLDAGSYIIIDMEITSKNGKKKRNFTFSKIERPQLMTKEEVNQLFNGYPRLDMLKKLHMPNKLKEMLDTGRLDVLKEENDDKESIAENKEIKKDIESKEVIKETLVNKPENVVSKSKESIKNDNISESEKSLIDQLRADLEGDDDNDDIPY